MAGDAIVLDYNNMLSPRLGGSHGIDPARVNEYILYQSEQALPFRERAQVLATRLLA